MRHGPQSARQIQGGFARGTKSRKGGAIMTIERPMFPPREESNAKIIDSKAWSKPQPAAKSRSRIKTSAELLARDARLEERIQQREDGLTETCKNSRLRESRRDVCRTADARRNYWHARLKFEDAIACAQNSDVPEGRSHPPHDRSEEHTSELQSRQYLVCRL